MCDLGDLADWRRVYRPCPVESITGEGQRALTERWLDAWRRLGGALPGRADFLPEDMAPWLPSLCLYDCVAVAGRWRFRMRVQGSAIRDMDGGDFTGCFLDDLVVSHLRPVILRDYACCVGRRLPCYTLRGVVNARGVDMLFEKVLLPLAGGDGGLGFVLACITTVDDCSESFDLQDAGSRVRAMRGEFVVEPQPRA